MTSFDHGSREEFFDYYAEASQSPETVRRFASIRDAALRVLARAGSRTERLDVADIGCGAGTQCLIWAEGGHRPHGLDVNEPLVSLARKRAETAGVPVDFRLGSATELPWAEASMDVCLVLELLEHVTEWAACLREFTRILRPGGVLVITTTNRLCPRQNEFRLPMYSWYPGRLKRRFERLAATTRPHLANYATYPAVNWFSFYDLRDTLAPFGFDCFDRFDAMDTTRASPAVRATVAAIRAVRALRWLGHVATQGTVLFAVRKATSPR